MMGINKVVTLRVPAEKLGDVNLAVEHGPSTLIFMPPTTKKPVWEEERKKGQEK
jgi:hypothetical protein